MDRQLDFWSSWSFPDLSPVVTIDSKQRISPLNYFTILARKKKRYDYALSLHCKNAVSPTYFFLINLLQKAHRHTGAVPGRSQCSGTLHRARQHPETGQAFPVWTAPMDDTNPRHPSQLHSIDVTSLSVSYWGEGRSFLSLFLKYTN